MDEEDLASEAFIAKGADRCEAALGVTTPEKARAPAAALFLLAKTL